MRVNGLSGEKGCYTNEFINRNLRLGARFPNLYSNFRGGVLQFYGLEFTVVPFWQGKNYKLPNVLPNPNCITQWYR